MHRLAKYTARFFAIMVVVASLSILCTPSPPMSGPYLSALSILTAGPVVAAGVCPNTGCSVHKSCSSGVPLTKCAGSQGHCHDRSC